MTEKNKTDLTEILNETLEECRHFTSDGDLADYIPELAKADRRDIGVCVTTSEGAFAAGDARKAFTIQSIAKPVFLALATMDNGIAEVKAHVGVEATGKPFNAIDYAEPLLLREHINPMVNIGAIAVCSLVRAADNRERLARLLDFARSVTGNPALSIDMDVYLSEKETGNKNRALAYLLKNSGMIEGDVESLLDVYFAMCSLRVNCCDLSRMGFVLANRGVSVSGQRLMPSEVAVFLNAVLTTSGMYDGSGEFATTVGIPAKSGVGGGIMADCPGRMGIGIYSPALDKKGNSIAGIRMLEQLSAKLDLSIF